MKLRISRNYLDFKEGKEYTISNPNEAKYMIAMGIAKEVVGKGGKAETAPVAKAKIAPVTKEEIKIDEKAAEVIPEDETEVTAPGEDFKDESSDDDDTLDLF